MLLLSNLILNSPLFIQKRVISGVGANKNELVDTGLHIHTLSATLVTDWARIMCMGRKLWCSYFIPVLLLGHYFAPRSYGLTCKYNMRHITYSYFANIDICMDSTLPRTGQSCITADPYRLVAQLTSAREGCQSLYFMYNFKT